MSMLLCLLKIRANDTMLELWMFFTVDADEGTIMIQGSDDLIFLDHSFTYSATPFDYFVSDYWPKALANRPNSWVNIYGALQPAMSAVICTYSEGQIELNTEYIDENHMRFEVFLPEHMPKEVLLSCYLNVVSPNGTYRAISEYIVCNNV